MAKAVLFGLTSVDPYYYGGWDGECPGCDKDVKSFAKMCGEEIKSYPSTILNKDATKDRFRMEMETAARHMKNSQCDLLVIFYSGHGGQMPDENGDELDGKDETLCLWDGQLIDDEVFNSLDLLPSGSRIFFVTDSCNSGTNFRSMPVNFRKVAPVGSDWDKAIIHYGGCSDGRVSYGSNIGGVFTGALFDSWYGVLKLTPWQKFLKSLNLYKAPPLVAQNYSYLNWFKVAQKWMPDNQKPVYAEYGKVDDRFRNAIAFS